MKVTVDVRNDNTNKWERIEIPDLLSERIAFMKTLVGKNALIHIYTNKITWCICGTEHLKALKLTKLDVEKQKRKEAGLPDKVSNITLSISEAHKLVEESMINPDPLFIMVYTVEVMTSKEDVQRIFPDPPKRPEIWIKNEVH